MKVWACVLLVLLALLPGGIFAAPPPPPPSPTPQPTPSITPTGTTTYSLYAATATGAGTTVDIGGFVSATMQVYSFDASVATVVIETRVDPSAPWTTFKTVTNPDSTGEMWLLPRVGQARANLTAYTSGTLYALTLRLYK